MIYDRIDGVAPLKFLSICQTKTDYLYLALAENGDLYSYDIGTKCTNLLIKGPKP